MRKILILLLLAQLPSTAYSQTIKGTAAAGTRVVAFSEGAALKNQGSASKFNFTALPNKSVRLVVQDSTNGKVIGPVIAAVKDKGTLTSYPEAKKDGLFKGGATGILAVSSTANKTVDLGKIKSASKNDRKSFYSKQLLQKRNVLATAGSNILSTGVLSSAGTFGLTLSGNSTQRRRISANKVTDSQDSDADGYPDNIDIDDDNDGILNSYETSAGAVNPSPEEDKLFSNLKVSIESSLNINANSAITQSQIDTLVKNNLTLAIPVASDGTSSSSEIDCSGLSYCMQGAQAVPVVGSGVFPGDFDADQDGFGTVTRGQTGDFQLRPNVEPAEIGAGDLITEIVTDTSGVETLYSRVIQFVFNTTPAVKTLSVLDGNNTAYTNSPYTVTYPVSDTAAGTGNNCFQAPSSGTVKLNITAWRPQRPGIAAAGEGSYMDVGNSSVIIDLPNAPCVLNGQGGCSGMNTSRCTAANFSTTDSNLSSDGDGLKDSFPDTASDPANTFSFTVDLSGCLSTGPVSWNSGETLFVDLQMKNSVGDNAAQKFCVKRD